MGQKKLNDSSMLNINKNMKVDSEDVVDVFGEKNFENYNYSLFKSFEWKLSVYCILVLFCLLVIC